MCRFSGLATIDVHSPQQHRARIQRVSAVHPIEPEAELGESVEVLTHSGEHVAQDVTMPEATLVRIILALFDALLQVLQETHQRHQRHQKTSEEVQDNGAATG